MTTKWPKKELYGKTDIWSLGFFQEKEMAAARERGEILEWYPNWHFIIDRPLNDTRMLGFTMWKYGISGIFLWHTICGWEKKGISGMFLAGSTPMAEVSGDADC